MPAQVNTSGPELGIRLAGGKTSYSHGDVVSGYISRSIETISDSARLTISLLGQCESRVTRSTGYTRTRTISQFKFFNAPQYTQIIYSNKPIDIQSGTNNGTPWSFTITIPEYADPNAIAAPDIDQAHSFLPLDPNAVATQLLPPSFGLGSATNIDGFVEYYLQAKLQFVRQRRGGFFSGGSKSESHEAIMPLKVEYRSPEPPIADFQSKRHTTTATISSHRLVPGMEDKKLSLSERTGQLLHPNKVPRLMFKIHLDVPTVLQLENENDIPLNISLEPIWSSTSDIIREVPQKFEVEHLVVRILPVTQLRMKKTSHIYTVSQKPMEIIADDSVGSLDTKISLTLAPPATAAHKDPEVVAVGKLVGFNLSRERIKRIAAQPWAKTLYPSFVSYIISRSYHFSWDLRGVMAGEKVRLEGKHTVTVLPPSRSR